MKIWCIFVVLQLSLLEVECEDLSCPEKWVAFKSHCYEFVCATRRQWIVAKDYCVDNGGYLASVTSSEESKFLQEQALKLGDDYYWLGGTDSSVEGTWEWISGETWNFTAWAENEPNNGHGSGQHCLGLWKHFGYAWDDRECSDSLRFICEVPASPVMTTALTTGVTESTISDINATDAMPTSVTDTLCSSELTAILIAAAVIILQQVTVAYV